VDCLDRPRPRCEGLGLSTAETPARLASWGLESAGRGQQAQTITRIFSVRRVASPRRLPDKKKPRQNRITPGLLTPRSSVRKRGARGAYRRVSCPAALAPNLRAARAPVRGFSTPRESLNQRLP
jgi:hypothetical protein